MCCLLLSYFRAQPCFRDKSTITETPARPAVAAGSKSSRLTNLHASSAPNSRSMPGSLHSTASGPRSRSRSRPGRSTSQSMPPWPGDAESQPRRGSPYGRYEPSKLVRPFKVIADVLDVDVKDAIGKSAQELDRIDALPVQMARIEGEAELLAAVQGVEHHFRRCRDRRRSGRDALRKHI